MRNMTKTYTYKQASRLLMSTLNDYANNHEGLYPDSTASFCMGYLKALQDNKLISEEVLNKLAEEYVGVVH
jgi:hypothetical protein